jgi:hypothetical protein
MVKRTVFMVVHATPEENQNGQFHYITCLEKSVAMIVANRTRHEKGQNYFVAIEKHHQCKRENENEFGWNADWESHPKDAVETVDYF